MKSVTNKFRMEVEIAEKSLLSEEQKLLIDESLSDLNEGKIYSQEQIVDEFNRTKKKVE